MPFDNTLGCKLFSEDGMGCIKFAGESTYLLKLSGKIVGHIDDAVVYLLMCRNLLYN